MKDLLRGSRSFERPLRLPRRGVPDPGRLVPAGRHDAGAVRRVAGGRDYAVQIDRTAIRDLEGNRFPGIDIEARLLREYPLAQQTAHVLGYVGRINEQELQQIRSQLEQIRLQADVVTMVGPRGFITRLQTVDTATLTEQVLAEVARLKRLAQARRAIVVYSFAPRDLRERLEAEGEVALRAPVLVSEVSRICHPGSPYEAPGQDAVAAMRLGISAPARRFDDSQLARAATIATSIGILAEEGKLDFHDPVRKHIPSFDNYRAGFIQIRHLLNHTSGFRIGTLFLQPSNQHVPTFLRTREQDTRAGKRHLLLQKL